MWRCTVVYHGMVRCTVVYHGMGGLLKCSAVYWERTRTRTRWYCLYYKHTQTLHTLCRLQNGYIRFDKCMSLARLVSQILAYKDTVVRQRVEHKYSMNCDCHLQWYWQWQDLALFPASPCSLRTWEKARMREPGNETKQVCLCKKTFKLCYYPMSPVGTSFMTLLAITAYPCSSQ